MTTQALIAELIEARSDFLAALDRIAPDSLTTPGLVGEWSGRELVAHLGFWAGRATEAIHAVEMGRVDELDAPGLEIDQLNATVARVARETDLATVRRREQASVEALLERLGQFDSSLLDVELPDGDTLGESIRVDGPAHYREHAAELRRTLSEGARG